MLFVSSGNDELISKGKFSWPGRSLSRNLFTQSTHSLQAATLHLPGLMRFTPGANGAAYPAAQAHSSKLDLALLCSIYAASCAATHTHTIYPNRSIKVTTGGDGALQGGAARRPPPSRRRALLRRGVGGLRPPHVPQVLQVLHEEVRRRLRRRR